MGEFFLFGLLWAILFVFANIAIGLLTDSRTPFPVCEWLTTPSSAHERMEVYTEALANASYDIKEERQRRRHVDQAMSRLRDTIDPDREA